MATTKNDTQTPEEQTPQPGISTERALEEALAAELAKEYGEPPVAQGQAMQNPKVNTADPQGAPATQEELQPVDDSQTPDQDKEMDKFRQAAHELLPTTAPGPGTGTAEPPNVSQQPEVTNPDPNVPDYTPPPALSDEQAARAAAWRPGIGGQPAFNPKNGEPIDPLARPFTTNPGYTQPAS